MSFNKHFKKAAWFSKIWIMVNKFYRKVSRSKLHDGSTRISSQSQQFTSNAFQGQIKRFLFCFVFNLPKHKYEILDTTGKAQN